MNAWDAVTTIALLVLIVWAMLSVYAIVQFRETVKEYRDKYFRTRDAYESLRRQPQNQPTLTIKTDFEKVADSIGQAARRLGAKANEDFLRRTLPTVQEEEPKPHAFCQETVTHSAHEWRHGPAFYGPVYSCEGWTKETGIRKHPEGYREYHECPAAMAHLPHKYNKGENRYAGVHGVATWCKGVEE